MDGGDKGHEGSGRDGAEQGHDEEGRQECDLEDTKHGGGGGVETGLDTNLARGQG